MQRNLLTVTTHSEHHVTLPCSGQLQGKFLGDLMKLSSSNTMCNPSVKGKFRQYVSQHRISRQKVRKCLENSEHSYDVIPISWYGINWWGPSLVLANQKYVLKWRHKCVNAGWCDLGEHSFIKVFVYLQGGPAVQAGPDLDRGLTLTC